MPFFFRHFFCWNFRLPTKRTFAQARDPGSYCGVMLLLGGRGFLLLCSSMKSFESSYSCTQGLSYFCVALSLCDVTNSVCISFIAVYLFDNQILSSKYKLHMNDILWYFCCTYVSLKHKVKYNFCGKRGTRSLTVTSHLHLHVCTQKFQSFLGR